MFCPYPYMHRVIYPNGSVKVCCNSTLVFKGLISEFNESDELLDIKQQMSKNLYHKSCEQCINTDSLRLNAKHEYPDEYMKLMFLDIRLSNFCNLKCKTCSPEFSSKIAGSITKMLLDQFKQIKQLMPTLSRVMFTGGEPMLHPEILELIELTKPDTEIQITTNGTVINSDILNILKNRNTHYTVSIDGTKHTNETIRIGTNHDKVIHNLHQYMKTQQSVAVNTVKSNLNAHCILDLQHEINEIHKLYPDTPFEHYINDLYYPEKYRV